MWLIPCSGGQGATWTLSDNIFDHVDFATYNGPVGNADHNAYIGMSTYLTPENQPTTDPKLSSLSYVSGPLGRFYLPSSATALIDAGSRTAGAAGLYHFTTQISNAKEAASQVDIGPHYLALVSGQPADSNGDGIPDFIADRNGNGIEDADEMPWQSANNGSVAVLSPAPNSVVSGVIQVQAALGAAPSTVSHVTALIDDQVLPGVSGLDNPAQSIASIEIDTSRLAPGTHSLAVETDTDLASSEGNGQTVTSQSITFTVQNPASFVNWQNRAQLLVNVSLQADPSVQTFNLHFFNSASAKAVDPQPIKDYSGTPSSGLVSYSQAPTDLGYGDASTDPTFYSFTEFPSPPPGTPAAMANKNILQDPTFPCEGWWAAAYDDGCVDFRTLRGFGPIFDPIDWQSQQWRHYDQLNNGWFPVGAYANDGTCPGYPSTVAAQPPPGSDPTKSLVAQTWPVRGAGRYWNREGFANDVQLLRNILSTPSVRNFYGLGHGNVEGFLFLGAEGDCFQRYRFAFLDGCQTISIRPLLPQHQLVVGIA